jgi:hypothetical protein
LKHLGGPDHSEKGFFAMAEFAHITPVRPSSPTTAVPSSDANDLLDAYSSWLFFKRHFLHIGRFGVAKALRMIDIVVINNVGAAFHLPSCRDLPDYAEPTRRAALVLAAAGVQVDGLARLAPKVRQNRDRSDRAHRRARTVPPILAGFRIVNSGARCKAALALRAASKAGSSGGSVEHLIRNEGVGGSNPSCGTNEIKYLN